jgi:hypothetical protein
MYNKFDTIWSKLDIKDKSVEKACQEKLKKTTWLMYIISKHAIFEEEGKMNMHGNHSLPEFAFLILAVLQIMVVHSNHTGPSADVEIGIIKSFRAVQEQETFENEEEGLSEFVMKFLESTLIS